MLCEKSRTAMMINKIYLEHHHGRIEDEWTCKFITDMKARLNVGCGFSEKQVAKLEELFERY